MNNNEFQGKTALITGASRGIGAATAIALARSGTSRIVLHYNQHKQGAEEAGAAAQAAGAQIEIIGADLATENGIEDLTRKLKDLRPGVDI
ncbi:MAG: SDR family NAD(P)-dependent oxidoreductase, partial [Bryobacteraceae bacterium]